MFYFDFNTNENIVRTPTFDIDGLSFYEHGRNFFVPSDNMTDNRNINEVNKDYLEQLNIKNDFFINLLLHSDFEDGMENPAILFVEKNLINNAFVTYLWLSNIYNIYLNISDYDKQRNKILSGILRIFAYISGNSYLKTIEPTLLGLIKLALSDNDLSVKESGIMLIEELRDLSALEILKNFDFSNTIIANYANEVIKELEKELSILGEVAV